jgi:hypothetical protein
VVPLTEHLSLDLFPYFNKQLPVLPFTVSNYRKPYLQQTRETNFQDGVSAAEGFLCVLRFEVSRFATTVQREFRARFKNTHHTRIMYFLNRT